MEVSAIVELFWSRNSQAISELQDKYGAACQSVAARLLGSVEDGQECLNDALHRVWDTVPPQRPRSLRAYLGKIVRNLAIDRWRERSSGCRDGEVSSLTAELEDCLPAAPSAEAVAQGNETAAAIGRWLGTLPKEDRVLFVRRYWYGDRVDELAKRRGVSPNNLAQRLFRLRSGLKRALEQEGVIL